MEGTVSVPRREDAVVPGERRARASSTASAAASAATSSSSSSCTTRSASRRRSGSSPARVGLHGAGAGRLAGRTREAQRDREALLKAHEVAAAWFREQLAAPPGACAQTAAQRSRISTETIERLGIGYAPASRGAEGAAAQGRVRATPLLRRAGCWSQRDGEHGARSIPKPADDSDLPRQRRDRRVRRAGDGGGAAAEVPELAGERRFTSRDGRSTGCIWSKTRSAG